MNRRLLTKKADYGLDGPPVIRGFALVGVAFVVVGGLGYLLLDSVQPLIARVLLSCGVLAGLLSFLSAGLMVRSSKVGKLRQREKLMDLVDLRGDEMVLDVGCGRGLLLNIAAKRLITGRAVGIDLWQTDDLTDNRPEATLANAEAEGVADRVEVKTGDMQQMPFLDGTFDVAVASMSIHNIRDKDGRAKAVREIARVLKPGGRVALQDFQCTDEYAQILREMGWSNVGRSELITTMWPPVRVVTGKKPM
jgi:arsenite methyltransferase